ncbi:metal ABC transporter permease [Pseudooceanicola batsensis]|uniref:metal ABC transporter permease n=1 Tax=Pseudooceanicola batsensis TaxID=314255 RepID=UPI000A30FD7E|nr:metal ABC transporter permease [Pseudooceanicola batsensis]
MFSEFMIRAALAGLGVALAAPWLGVFVVWRRMAYFGDAVAHAAVLGVALSLMLELPVVLGVMGVAVIVALAIAAMETPRGGIGADSLLGVLSHGALAFGLIAVSFLPGARLNLEAYLFGDILAVSWGDVAVIWGGAAAIVGVIAWRWRALLTSTVNPDLAWSSGMNPDHDRRILTLALALLVALAIKVVGALLITALLIIPAAAARPLSRSPEVMLVAGMGIGAVSALCGLGLSYEFDTPAGPSIVAVAVVAFALGRLMPARSAA